MNVLFIHSSGPQSDTEGSGRLVTALRSALLRNINLSAPLMPDPDDPNAAAWSKAIGEHLAAVDKPFVLVGHSLGGSAILQYLALHDAPSGMKGVVSIAAPFWGANMREWTLPPGFATRLSRLPRLVLYHSRDDDEVPIAHVDRYAAAIPTAIVRKVDGRGHLFDDGDVADIVEDIRGGQT
ncbi:MAG: alpha/beta fold hydrolase [Propylenella sp.]